MGPRPTSFLASPTSPTSANLALRTLPPQPSLEQLKNQAKTLLAAFRGGNTTAQARIAAHFPAIHAEWQATLTQAQLVIAREHGYPSWTKLRRAVQLAPLRAQLERFTERGWIPRRDTMQALQAAGSDGMQVVLEALSHPHPMVRRGAVDYLDHYVTDSCIPQLVKVARHDPDPEVRRRAVHALICEGCKETPLETDVFPQVIQALLGDPNRRVRFTAALLLRRHGALPRVRQAFLESVRQDASGYVRRVSVTGLRDDEESLLLLARVAQHDPDPHVRVTAAIKLGRSPDASLQATACRVLEAVLAEDPKHRVKHDAHLALKQLSPEYRALAAQRAREASQKM